jgi:surface carbohydrate biosynthesis protein (TIGR04326 family)
MIGIGKKERIPRKSVLFFSFFPYFWIKSSKSGFFENFFRSVPKQISKWAPVHYAVWFTLSNPFLICKQRKEIRKNFCQLNMISIESYLSLKDFVYVFLFSIHYIGKILKYRFNIQPKVKVFYEGSNITNIVVEELNQSLFSSEIFRGILMMKSIENMVSKNAISALIYRIEFQPYERAIEYGAADRCMTIAFQHQAIGRNHLQYFFPKIEITQCYSDKNNLDNLPLPDKILVTGEYPFEILKNAGFHEKDIGICGPVRYAGLVEYKKSGKTKSEIRKKYGFKDNQHIFLIASPSVKEEMLNLILSLVHALKENNNFIFLFKSHPVYKFDKEVVDIINEFYPKMNYSFLTDDVNLNDYLVLSDALILTATTVGIEAICLGTIPILFENNSTFSLNPLLEIKNSYLSVKNSQELKEALFSVINDDAKILELKKHWPEAIRKLFYNIDEDPNAKFSSFIKNYIK